MADLKGVGTPITYSEDNPVLDRVHQWREPRWKEVREPKDDEERVLLADWLGCRGRSEAGATGIVGAGTYAYTHFDMDIEWRHLLSEHIAEECGHGYRFVQLADRLDPSKDHSKPDRDFETKHMLADSYRANHAAIIRRDFLSFLFAGNPWIYGHVTATVRMPIISAPEVINWQRNEQMAGERDHHYAMLQKMHDTVWELIERYGEVPVRKRIAEIDEEALNNNSRTLWDPPTRDFCVKYLGCSLEMAPLFFDWREYLYQNVLGWDPEPVTIREWPEGVPTSSNYLMQSANA